MPSESKKEGKNLEMDTKKIRIKTMKKKNIATLVLVLILFLGLFVLWQYGIYQKISKMDISCRGDWSSSFQCPLGSYCQSLKQGPWAGALCKPFLTFVFDVLNRPKSIILSKTLSILPLKKQTTEKIISSEITVEGCKIKLATTKGEIFLNTNFLDFYPQIKCYQFLLNKISPSGKYLVFQDISGGLDSMLKVFSIEHNDTVALDVFGTASIFDICFLPNDKLAVLHGYKGIFSEQYLRVFDLPGLFSAYPSNLDKQYKFFTNLLQYSKNVALPNIGRDYSTLSISDSKLNIYGSEGENGEVLKQYSFDEL